MTKQFCIMMFLISMILLMQNRPSYSQEIDQEEYKIYQVVIEEKYLSQSGYIDFLDQIKKGDLIDQEKHVFKNPEVLLPKTIIIINKTIWLNRSYMGLYEILDSLLKDNKAQKSIIESWKKINTKSLILKDSFSFSTEHILITEEQLSEALTPSKWQSFYEHYPKALGCFWLSRVAFDDNKTSAVVYIKNVQDGKWGSGIFYVLSKSDSKKWEIVKEYLDIIS
jgi:hypothetical protein